MKKNYALTLLLLLVCRLVCAQERGDYQWLLGYYPNDSAARYGGTVLDFSSGQLDQISFRAIYRRLTEATSLICDDSGKILLYTDGCQVLNRNDELIGNGDSLNFPGKAFSQNCPLNLGYLTHSGTVTLQKPAKQDHYFMVHLRNDQSEPPGNATFHYPRSLLFTEIDMTANQGAGRVTRKNEVLLRDSFADMLAAVRHGNGRDWWIAAPRLDAPRMFLFRLAPDGIDGPYERATPLPWKHDYNNFSRAQAVFSPDGTRYARLDTENGLQIYDFDRCSGEFSNGILIDMRADTLYAAGLAFSPSGRFLYASTGRRMYQIDLAAPDANASKYLVGVYDGFRTHLGLWTTFYQQRLAPDGKIYMSATNGVYYLHVVHEPDRYRDSCRFEQHAVELPTHNGFTLPNFPNFRLYDWAGSPCDTAGVSAPPDRRTYWPGADDDGLRVLPNPAVDYALLVLPASAYGPVHIYTAAGQLLRVLPDVQPGEAYRFAIHDWPAGVYVAVVADRRVGRRAGRFVVHRRFMGFIFNL